MKVKIQNLEFENVLGNILKVKKLIYESTQIIASFYVSIPMELHRK